MVAKRVAVVGAGLLRAERATKVFVVVAVAAPVVPLRSVQFAAAGVVVQHLFDRVRVVDALVELLVLLGAAEEDTQVALPRLRAVVLDRAALGGEDSHKTDDAAQNHIRGEGLAQASQRKTALAAAPAGVDRRRHEDPDRPHEVIRHDPVVRVNIYRRDHRVDVGHEDDDREDEDRDRRGAALALAAARLLGHRCGCQ